MKVLFISSLYYPNQLGGAEKVVRTVAEGMLEHGHEPVVITMHDGPRDRTDRVNGVTVHYIGLKNIYWPYSHEERPGIAKALWHGINRYNPLMERAVARVLDAEEPDVVNTHNLTGFSCAVWDPVVSRRLPLIHTLHDYSLMCPRTSMFRGGENCQGQCTMCAFYTSPGKRMSRAVGHVVGVSRFTLDRHLAAGYFQRGAGAGDPQRDSGQARGRLPGRTAPMVRCSLDTWGTCSPQKGIRELIRQMADWQCGAMRVDRRGQGRAGLRSAAARGGAEERALRGIRRPG